MFKISIIIPCYNVEKYIDRCMNSIVNQTIGIENLEIILVNDASTDNTLDYLRKWEEKYPDEIVVVTYEQNKKQGGARNVGLNYASADYVGFVDADDWIEPDMYEELYSCIVKDEEETDTVCGMFIRDNGDGIVDVTRAEWGSVCTHLYRKSIILENQIFFPENITYEDNYWGKILDLYIKNTKYVNKVLYHYYVNPSSTVTRRNDFGQLDRMIIEIMILDKYIELGIFEKNIKQTFFDFLEKFYLNTWFIIFTRFDEIPDILPIARETMEFYFPDYKEYLRDVKYSYRGQLLIDMLCSDANVDLMDVKQKYLESWLVEKGNWVISDRGEKNEQY